MSSPPPRYFYTVQVDGYRVCPAAAGLASTLGRPLDEVTEAEEVEDRLDVEIVECFTALLREMHPDIAPQVLHSASIDGLDLGPYVWVQTEEYGRFLVDLLNAHLGNATQWGHEVNETWHAAWLKRMRMTPDATWESMRFESEDLQDDFWVYPPTNSSLASKEEPI